MTLKRVGILTGGGDCSGLNAVIRAITRAAIINHNSTVIGIEDGFEGLIFDRKQELTMRSTRYILPLGGTILRTSNKGNPFDYREFDDNGNIVSHDYSEKAIKTFKKMMLDCLFVVGGEEIVQTKETLQGVARLGGVGNYIASKIAKEIDLEVRCTVLGHIQRGGTPLAFDRVLGTRLGEHAVQAASEGKFGHMVSLKTPDIMLVPLEELAGKVRRVPPASQLVKCAEDIGISLGR